MLPWVEIGLYTLIWPYPGLPVLEDVVRVLIVNFLLEINFVTVSKWIEWWQTRSKSNWPEETCGENKNPSRIFPPDFDILSETLEFLIEGHVFAQGQKADSEGEAARI